MKTFKTALAVITAALLAMALLASPSSAATGTKDQPDTGGLSIVNADTHADLPGPYVAGQQVKLYANFSGGVRDVNFYRETAPDTWTLIGTDEANTYGNAYLPYTIVEGDTKIFAEDVNDAETEVDTITGDPLPPSGAVLDTPAANSLGKTWTAHFTGAAKNPGATTTLRIREICTYETDETNPETGAFDPDVKQKDCKGPWKTIETGTQNSNGDTTFSLPDKFEVKHTYRATSGSVNSNEVDFAPAFVPDDPYDISTGLSEVHFNTYEQASVNTRDHYFEGAFSMTSSTKNASPTGTTCPEATDKDGKTVIMKSVMKGRGNYSWSFPKKSFTLKTGDKLDLCGLGKSKKYALVANDYDKSLMRNSLAGYVGSKLNGMAWTPKSVPVDFYMNGSYRGTYLLIERIAIQGPKTGETHSRIDIDELSSESTDAEKTGGYVLEWDFRKGADYNADLGSDSGWVGVKEPENDYGRTGSSTGTGVNTGKGITTAQKTYIKSFLNKVDTSLRAGPSWQTYIDKESAVDYYIAMEYMKPVDGNMWASVYMYKPRGEEKLYFGPLWDFDLAAGSATRAGNVASSSSFYLRNNLGISAQQSSKTWFHRLNEYPSFRQAVADRWDEIKGGLNVTGHLSGQKAILQQAQAANFQKWGRTSRISEYQVIKGSWDGDTGYLSTWAANRKSWLSGGSGF